MNPSLLASYLVQAAGALFTAILFGFLSRAYRKAFLLHWARSFSALCIMLFGAGLTISLSSMDIGTPQSFSRLTVSAITSVAAYTHVAWLLFGATELFSSRWAERFQRYRNWIFGAAALVGLVVVSLYLTEPNPFGPRFTARIAIRSLVIGVAFSVAAISVAFARGTRTWREFGRILV